MNEEYIIRLDNVSKAYDGTNVVKNVSLKIRRGEFVTLLGPSGCGKTTTLRMLAGFEMPSSGSIFFDGEEISSVPPYKRPINTVFQKYALFPHLNVFKNIAFGLKLKRVPVPAGGFWLRAYTAAQAEEKHVFARLADGFRRRFLPDYSVTEEGELVKLVNMKHMPTEQKYTDKDGSERVRTLPFKRCFEYATVTDKKGARKRRKVNAYDKYIADKVRRALKIVGLSDYEDRDVNSLSGGQQQRVAIARAIVNEPKVLLLDEPLGALDLKMRQEMQLELKSMHKKLGITFIYVTHDQEEALTMSDTVVVMRDGKICQEGSPMDIYNEPVNAYVADFIGESNILDGVMLEDCLVSFAGATFTCVDEGFGIDKPVDVVVRPEDWLITEVGKGVLDGKITGSIFKGVHYEMTCVANGFELLLHNTVEYPAGSNIGLNVKPSDIQIMYKEKDANVCPVRFTGNTTFELYGASYEFDPETALESANYDAESDVLLLGGEEVTLKGMSGTVRFEFTDIDLTDNADDAPLAGNVEDMIFKGKNYLVSVRTDVGHHIYADTEYLWDKGDRVGIAVEKDKFRCVGAPTAE